MGVRAGAKTVLVKTGYGLKTIEEAGVKPDYIAADVLKAAYIIKEQLSSV